MPGLSEFLKVNEVFSKQMEAQILSICMIPNENLFVTTENSNILCLDLKDKSEKSLETRGSSLINKLCSGECFPNNHDLIGGDSEGNVVMVIDSKQIFNTQRVLPAGVCQLIYSCNKGAAELVAGDRNGIIVGVNMFFDINWRINLPLLTSAKTPSPIRSLTPVVLLDADQIPSFFVLATDSRPIIHFLFKGRVMVSIDVPCVVNTICQGRFLSRPEAPPEFSLKNPEFKQLVFGGDDGIIYLLDHFEPHVYADLEFYITFITSNKSPNQNDTVLAAGHFVGCVVLRDGNQLFRIETEDWVVEISVWKKYIALATMDQQVKVVTLPSDGEFVVE